MYRLQVLASRIPIWIQLTRLDRPIGWIVLLWPTWIALVIAGHLDNHHQLKTWIIFTLGVIVTRSAGCVINDLTDKDFDRHVKRTQLRPITAGKVDSKEALWLAFLLLLIAFALVLMTNLETIFLSIIALFLAVIYPWLKRYTFWPQIGLGLAFSMAIPMVFAAHGQELSRIVWILFAANTFWTLSYDTFYAMVDRDDDLKIGVKSTAIKFGHFDLAAIAIIQIIALALFSYGLWLAELHWIFLIGVIGAIGFGIQQQIIAKDRLRENYLQAFQESHRFGAALFVGTILGIWY